MGHSTRNVRIRTRSQGARERGPKLEKPTEESWYKSAMEGLRGLFGSSSPREPPQDPPSTAASGCDSDTPRRKRSRKYQAYERQYLRWHPRASATIRKEYLRQQKYEKEKR